MAIINPSKPFEFEKSLGLLSSLPLKLDDDGSSDSDSDSSSDSDADGSTMQSGDPEEGMERVTTHAEEFQQSLPVFLEEIMKHEAPMRLSCDKCQKVGSIFRCLQCSTAVYCQDCLLDGHKLLPLHDTEKWTGEYWTTFSFIRLGLVYQLGHGGEACLKPSSESYDVVVIDLHGICYVNVKFCECTDSGKYGRARQLLSNRWYPDGTINGTIDDAIVCATFAALDAFNTFDATCNIKSQDFILSLARLSLSETSVLVDDEECKFLQRCLERMSRQYATISRLKRSGEYINIAINQGQASFHPAIKCWACPQPDMNLPSGWRDAEPDKRQEGHSRLLAESYLIFSMASSWLFALRLEVDGAYELKGDVTDHSTHCAQSWESSPSPAILYYVDERTKGQLLNSSRAVRPPDGKHGPGDGLIVAVCARHRLFLPQGVAELRGGVTTRQIDHIILSAVQGTQLQEICISNPVGCLWSAGFVDRTATLYSPEYRLDPSITVTMATPNWEGISVSGCTHSSALIRGKYWVRGETNKLLSSIRAAWPELACQPEQDRQFWINERIDLYNFQMNLGLGDKLLEQLCSAQKHLIESTVIFKVIDQYVGPANRKAWKERIDAWERKEGGENPYLPKYSECKSQSMFIANHNLLELATRSLTNSGGDTRLITKWLLHGMILQNSQATFLIESQYKDNDDEGTRDARNNLTMRLKEFRRSQCQYMTAFELFKPDAHIRDCPERVILWMPSEFPRTFNRQPELEKIELELRIAECQDARQDLTSSLQTARYIAFLPEEMRKSPDALNHLRSVEVYAARYRRSRAAIEALQGDVSNFEELGDYNFASYPSDFNAIAFAQNLARIYAKVSPNSTSQEARKEIEEYMRIEWTRSFTRCNRYWDEIVLVREEMRRVRHFLESQALWWEMYPHTVLLRETREEFLRQEDADEGRIAFAHRQADFLRRVAGEFKTLWGDMALESNPSSPRINLL